MPLIPDGPAMTPAERRKIFPKATGVNPARAYTESPGTGPAGETCGSCAHHVVLSYSKRYHKCELTVSASVATDIQVRSPACAKWESIDDG